MDTVLQPLVVKKKEYVADLPLDQEPDRLLFAEPALQPEAEHSPVPFIDEEGATAAKLLKQLHRVQTKSAERPKFAQAVVMMVSECFEEGDRVKIIKIGTCMGCFATVTNPRYADRVKVQLECDASRTGVKSYVQRELVLAGEDDPPVGHGPSPQSSPSHITFAEPHEEVGLP